MYCRVQRRLVYKRKRPKVARDEMSRRAAWPSLLYGDHEVSTAHVPDGRDKQVSDIVTLQGFFSPYVNRRSALDVRHETQLALAYIELWLPFSMPLEKKLRILRESGMSTGLLREVGLNSKDDKSIDAELVD